VNLWKHFSHLYFLTSCPILKIFPANDLFIRTKSVNYIWGIFCQRKIFNHEITLDAFVNVVTDKLRTKGFVIFDRMAMFCRTDPESIVCDSSHEGIYIIVE